MCGKVSTIVEKNNWTNEKFRGNVALPIYRIFSNKRPRSFKRPSAINAPFVPVIIL